ALVDSGHAGSPSSHGCTANVTSTLRCVLDRGGGFGVFRGNMRHGHPGPGRVRAPHAPSPPRTGCGACRVDAASEGPAPGAGTAVADADGGPPLPAAPHCGDVPGARPRVNGPSACAPRPARARRVSTRPRTCGPGARADAGRVRRPVDPCAVPRPAAPILAGPFVPLPDRTHADH